MIIRLHAHYAVAPRFAFRPENPLDEYLIEQIGSYRRVYTNLAEEAKALAVNKQPIRWSDFIRLVRQEQFMLPVGERASPSTVADWVALYNDSVVTRVGTVNSSSWRAMTDEEIFVRLVMSYKQWENPGQLCKEEQEIQDAAWAVSMLRKHKIERVLGI